MASQIDRVNAALQHAHFARGPHLEELQQRLRDLFGKKHVVLTGNGFSALFVTLKTLQPGATVVTAPASTCFAVPNAILAAGHEPGFIDLDGRTAGMAANPANAHCGVAVVPDHFGLIAPLNSQGKPGISFLIEDAAQAFISRASIATSADVVVLSFYPTKMINGIDGGAVLTDDGELYERISRIASYDGQIAYAATPRYNLRMNNLNAAVALGTLDEFDVVRASLLERFGRLTDIVQRVGWSVLGPRDGEVPSRFIVQLDSQARRDAAVSDLRSKGVEAACELLWVCVPAFRSSFPQARALIDTTFSLPYHATLTEAEIRTIARAIRN